MEFEKTIVKPDHVQSILNLARKNKKQVHIESDSNGVVTYCNTDDPEIKNYVESLGMTQK